MTAATWILIYKKPQDAAPRRRGAEVLRLGLREGRQVAGELDYVPMPANVVKDVQASWAADIKDATASRSTCLSN